MYPTIKEAQFNKLKSASLRDYQYPNRYRKSLSP